MLLVWLNVFLRFVTADLKPATNDEIDLGSRNATPFHHETYVETHGLCASTILVSVTSSVFGFSELSGLSGFFNS
jgi:hypothetical protein